jgi:hypothetical protein
MLGVYHNLLYGKKLPELVKENLVFLQNSLLQIY